MAALVAAAACGDPGVPELGNSWVAENLGGGLTMFISLTVEGTDVEGTGSLGTLTNAQPTALAITGSYVRPEIDLDIESALGLMTFTGTLTAGGRLEGVLDGAVFTNRTVTFSRR